MPKLYKKTEIQQDVLSASIERIHYLYKRFDNLCVSFSGGKDSTAVLAVTLRVAKELGRLPLRVIFIDEEVIHPQTIEYVTRVRERGDVAMDWYCMPFKHRNACSNEQPYWYTWNPAEKDLWVRDMPPWAITAHPTFEFGQSYQEWMSSAFAADRGTWCLLTGIRSQESLRRMRLLLMKRNDAYITTRAKGGGNTYLAHPVYDWRTEDVWKLVSDWKLDYNRVYDVFNRTKLFERYTSQRVCQPFGEEPIRGLAQYAECFPDMWAKMVHRVRGVNTAYRYSNTELYGVRFNKPDGMSWHDYCTMLLMEEKDPVIRGKVLANIEACKSIHERKSTLPLPESEPDPVSGASWKFFAKIAIKRDLKGRTSQGMLNEAHRRCARLGLTPEQAIELWGRK